MKTKTFFSIVAVAAAAWFVPASAAAPREFNLSSPDGRLALCVTTGETTLYSLSVDGECVLAPSRIAMRLADGRVLGDRTRVSKASTRRAAEHIVAPLYRQREFTAEYNGLDLRMSGGYGIEFRAYDDGVAYRFYSSSADSLTVAEECVEFNMAGDYPVIIPYADRRPDIYESSFESQYTFEPASAVRTHTDRLAFMPAAVDLGSRGWLLLTEADVEDYPGLFVAAGSLPYSLRGVHPPVPAETRITGSGSKRPVAYGDFIARTGGRRTFPWRVAAYAADDRQLPVNNMVFQLAAPSRIADTGWIRGGRSTWDWWNGARVFGVDFRAGINTRTYMYHIDFAARFGIEYVLIDDGWYRRGETTLFEPVEDIDIEALCRYGEQKGVRIILWAVGNALLSEAESVCGRYAAMGVAGFKVDFFDAQDQLLVRDIYALAEATARHRLLIDFHGMYKPTGLSRTWPNVVNYEGVFGLEQMKWTDRDRADMPLNDVTIPFVRMAAGPMDYTQGAMINASKADFRAVDKRPMSQGTRAHQVAMYVVYDSPLVMLCDSPSHYLREQETTRFICDIPSVFDRTQVLDGRVGEYIVTARERDGAWYVGGMTSWQPRTVGVDCSFLGEGEWEVRLFRDGVNSDLSAEDYRIETLRAGCGSRIDVGMAPGGGFAAIFTRLR
ncbi:MAG: glycoside hydrolase family 97 protein [Alistipes sp.]|nr:glycoside hydrolase family 97 protein [Alistipes sp.]